MDQFALKCLENELHKTYKVLQNKKILDFERKTKEDKTIQTGLSMEQLKAQHQEIADHQKAVKSLQDQAENLTSQNNDVQSQVSTVTQNLKNIYEATTGQQAVDKDGNDLSPLEMANGITKAARGSREAKQQAETDAQAAEEKQKATEEQQKQQEQQLTQQRQQLQNLQNQINDADEQIKQHKLQRIKAAQQEIDRNDLADANNQPITVTENNVTQIEQELDEWRQEQRTNWETDKQNYHDELNNITKELTSKRTEKADLTNTNQQLSNQNQQLQNDNQIMQKQINGYKNQLVDTIAENAPEHKVESSLLKPNETAQPVISDTGRQQHLRQTLKYLMDTTTKVLQKIKTEATNFINQITQTLTQPTQNQQSNPAPQHSAYLDPSSIERSDKPFDHRKELKLMNDPAIKLKKAILLATNEQLQRTNQQLKNNITKQLNQDNDLQR